MMEKIMFWKKKDDTSFGLENPMLKPEPLMPPLHEEVPVPPQQQRQETFFQAPNPEDFEVKPLQPQAQERASHHVMTPAERDIQLIIARLETIKVILDNILIRLDKIEKEKERTEVKW